MEHRIGEIVTLPDGRKAEVVEWDVRTSICDDCIFYKIWKAPYREECLNPDIYAKCSARDRTDHKNVIFKEIKGVLNMEPNLKGWFDCLNAVAIELEADKSRNIQQNLIHVMHEAGISLSEVRWAQDQNYTTLDKSGVLIDYEGMLMYQEELEEL